MRSRTLKRLMDIVVSVVLLLVFSPLMLIIGLAIFAKMGSPVLFCQHRPGYRGIPFKLIKFRTMTEKGDSLGCLLADEDRLTGLGKFLRATSLDELPELLNVIRGEMSLVGPRPLLLSYLDRYTFEQARRHNVRPGITGYAQVHGRNAMSWERRFALDLWYVDNWTLLLDLQILFKTLHMVARREGISAVGHATMPEFSRKDEKGLDIIGGECHERPDY